MDGVEAGCTCTKCSRLKPPGAGTPQVDPDLSDWVPRGGGGLCREQRTVQGSHRTGLGGSRSESRGQHLQDEKRGQRWNVVSPAQNSVGAQNFNGSWDRPHGLHRFSLVERSDQQNEVFFQTHRWFVEPRSLICVVHYFDVDINIKPDAQLMGVKNVPDVVK